MPNGPCDQDNSSLIYALGIKSSSCNIPGVPVAEVILLRLSLASPTFNFPAIFSYRWSIRSVQSYDRRRRANCDNYWSYWWPRWAPDTIALAKVWRSASSTKTAWRLGFRNIWYKWVLSLAELKHLRLLRWRKWKLPANWYLLFIFCKGASASRSQHQTWLR
jgi:hypothetical protein